MSGWDEKREFGAESEEEEIYRAMRCGAIWASNLSLQSFASLKYQESDCQDLILSRRTQRLAFSIYTMASSDLERCTSYGRGGAGNLRRPSVVEQAKEILASMPSNDSENCTFMPLSCSWSEC